MAPIMLLVAAALVGCTPSPQENAMHSPSPDPATLVQAARETGSERQASGAPDRDRPNKDGQGAADEAHAAQAPSPAPVSAAEKPAAAQPADLPAEAEGRRTLSTAFVMTGPDRRVTVELRNGRVLVLRDLVMRAKDYCGVQLLGGPPGVLHCGGYAEVAAARPGGAPAPAEPDRANSNPAGSPRAPAERK